MVLLALPLNLLLQLADLLLEIQVLLAQFFDGCVLDGLLVLGLVLVALEFFLERLFVLGQLHDRLLILREACLELNVSLLYHHGLGDHIVVSLLELLLRWECHVCHPAVS